MSQPTMGQTDVTATLPMVRCPHCRHAFTVEEAANDEIDCSACGKHFNLLRQSTSMIPTRVGRFELKESLGMGSFGAVFRARDTNLHREVAVKIPRHREIKAAEILEAMHEARVAATLRHPNIVTVHEVGRDGEWIYIVSDLIRGLPLNKWAAETPLTIRQQVELCRKLSLALAHAHESGIVHRDLKPANILIDEGGEPHLTDFSLAKRDVDDVAVTMDGQIFGTPAYMSPEQAKGDAHRCDQRSDVYSLGVVLFELMTGELPFRGNLNVLTRKVINEPPPSPRQLNNQVSPDLDTICLKCLRKDPRHRYQSAIELADDLQNWLDGRPVQARPLGFAERSWRWCRQHPLESGFGCAVALTLLLFICASVVISDQRRRGIRIMLNPIHEATLILLREQMVPVVASAASRFQQLPLNARDPDALTEFLRNEFDNPELRRQLADREIEIESWFILGQDGKIQAIWPEAMHVMGVDFSGRDYFRNAVRREPSAGPYIGQTYRSKNNRRFKVPISVALRSDPASPDLTGVLAVSVSTPETLVMDLTTSLERQVSIWMVVVLMPMTVFVIGCFVMRIRRNVNLASKLES